jgi:hypothetical protein
MREMSAREWAEVTLFWLVVTAVALWFLGAWGAIPAFCAGASYNGFAQARKIEQDYRIIRRTVCENGAVVVTSQMFNHDTGEWQYMSSAVDEDGEVVANEAAPDEKAALRLHKEHEARVG